MNQTSNLEVTHLLASEATQTRSNLVNPRNFGTNSSPMAQKFEFERKPFNTSIFPMPVKLYGVSRISTCFLAECVQGLRGDPYFDVPCVAS